MTILLPIEIKVREFHSKIFLASKLLDKTNFDVVIGEKNKVYNLFKHNHGVYLLSKGGPRLRFSFDKKIYDKNFLGILDEEGPISNLDIYSRKSRLHKDILKNSDDYFLWGNKDLEVNKPLLKKFGKNLHIFGHPKFDILKTKFIKFYQKEINSLKKKYGKFIFIPSSFRADQIMKDSDGDKFRLENFFYVMEKKKDLIKKDVSNYLKVEKENYLNLISLVKKIASQNPNINIIFRPHPRQRIDLVKKRFGNKNKNIKVIYDGVITPWIAACELYLHGGCTSFLEAASLEKKIVYFVSAEHKNKAKMFKKFGYYFNDLSKCLKFMNSNIKQKKFNLKKSSRPKFIIANSDKKLLFFEKFSNFLNKKYSNKLKKLKYFYNEKNTFNKYLSNKKALIKRMSLETPILSDILFKMDGSNILTQEYKLQKFPNLLKKEVQDCLHLKTGSKKKIIIEKLSENLFYLKRVS